MPVLQGQDTVTGIQLLENNLSGFVEFGESPSGLVPVVTFPADIMTGLGYFSSKIETLNQELEIERLVSSSEADSGLIGEITAGFARGSVSTKGPGKSIRANLWVNEVYNYDPDLRAMEVELAQQKKVKVVEAQMYIRNTANAFKGSLSTQDWDIPRFTTATWFSLLHAVNATRAERNSTGDSA